MLRLRLVTTKRFCLEPDPPPPRNLYAGLGKGRRVSSKYDDYHRNADYCLRMALSASSDEYRASWLAVAQSWLRMIPPDRVKTAQQIFDEYVQAHGTGQDDSTSSH